MKTPLLVVVALAIALILFFVFRDGSRPAAPDAATPVESGVAETTVPEAAVAEATSAPQEPATEPDLPSPPATPDSVSERSAAPERWIEGTIVLPADTPADEQLTVQDAREVIDPIAVELARPSFRIPVPKDVDSLRLTLSARYLRLPGGMRVELAGEGVEVTLEPELGAYLLVQLSPPEGRSTEELERTGVRLYATRENAASQRTTGQALGQGRFEFRALSAEALYSATIEGSPFADAQRDAIRLFAGRATTLDVPLDLGARIEGLVIGPDGAGLAGAKVEGKTENPLTGVYRWLHPQTTETDVEGRFTIEGVTAGEVRVSASADGSLSARIDIGAIADGEVRTGVALQLSSGGHIAGVVRWPDGSPAAGATVRASAAQNRWSSGTKVTADADGRFELVGLAGNLFVVSARARREGNESADGAGPAWWRARADGVSARSPESAAIELVLEAGDTLVGSVVDDAGAPIDRFTIRARPLDEALSWRSEAEVREKFSKAAGRFELAGLTEGTWDVRAEAKGHPDARWQRVRVPEGLGELTFTLLREATVAGTVTDPDGQIVAGAKVFARAEGAEADAKTRDDGSFEVRGVVPAAVELSATGSGFYASPSVELALLPGEQRSDVQLVLRRGARLTGEVDASITDFAERKILASPVHAYEFNTTLCDENGRFAFEGLAPGAWRVSFDWRPSGGGGDWVAGYQRRAEQVVELTLGETVHVVLGAPRDGVVQVAGRVSDRGEPCTGFIVYVFPADDHLAQPHDITRTDDSGHYALTVPSAGTYRFTVGLDQGKQKAFVVDVPEGATYALDFEMPTAVVTGRVVHRGGEPLAGHMVMLRDDSAPWDSRALGAQSLIGTGEDGSFRFEGLAPGRYHLRTGGWGGDSKGLATTIVGGIELAEGDERTGLTVEVDPEAVVEGSVVDASGQPVDGAVVHVLDAAGNELDIWSRTTSDYTGAFRIRGVSAGVVTVIAEHESEGAPRRAESSIDVTAGAVVPVVLEFEP